MEALHDSTSAVINCVFKYPMLVCGHRCLECVNGFVSCSVYSGHQSILIPPSELETNPALWLLAVSQYKVRDTFCSYSVMELCTKGLGSQTESLKVSGSALLHALPPAQWGRGALDTLLNVCWDEKISRGHRQLPQNPRYSLPKAVDQYWSFFRTQGY